MRSDLDHLPADRQAELQLIVRILFEEFEDTIARTTDPRRKKGRILKIILFGSFARGDWVDDPVSGYHSDYDILVVVNDERLTDFEYWAPAEDRLLREATITRTLSATVGFVVHSLTDLNAKLYKGNPFLSDVAAQGVALYEAEGHPFSKPGRLTIGEKLAEARQHFDYWFALAARSVRTFQLQRAEGDDAEWRRKAAFEAHQASEQLYHCVLLTLKSYSPKSHKLNFLRGQVEDVAPSLIEAWPRADRFSRRCFELLRQAYVNARYSSEYAISAEELCWIGERVAILQDRVSQVCKQRLADLESALPRAAE